MITLHMEASPQLAKLVCPTMSSLQGTVGAAWTRKDMVDYATSFQAAIGASYSNFGSRTDKLKLTVRLPEHLKVSVRFLATLWCEWQISDNRNVTRSLKSLHDRLRHHLGLPDDPESIRAVSTIEQQFLMAIYAEPDDVLNWMAYGDWLEEQGNGRGLLIQRNLDGKQRTYKRWR